MHLLVHAGAPKAGSSSLQSHIFVNREWFLRRGVYVPQAGFYPGFGHATLFYQHPGFADTRLARPIEQASTDDLQLLIEELEGLDLGPGDRILLSWEGFILLGAELVQHFADSLGESVTVQLYLYIREQSRYVESTILQFIKSFPTLLTFAELTRDLDKLLEFGLDYFDALASWEAAFVDRVKVSTRVYDRSLLANSDVVDDFLEWIGLDSLGFVKTTRGHNASLDMRDAMLLSVVKAANVDEESAARIVRLLLNKASTSSSNRFLDASVSNRIWHHFRESNRRLLETYRPENIRDADPEDLFPTPTKNQDLSNDIVIKYLESIVEPAGSMKEPYWDGLALNGRDVEKVVVIEDGWRTPEVAGIWSTGKYSRIRFEPVASNPPVDRTLRLRVRGRYLGKNSMTRLHFSGSSQDLSLKDGELDVLLPAQRDNLVEIVLEHKYPVSPLDLGVGKSEQLLAFMLTSISYRIFW